MQLETLLTALQLVVTTRLTDATPACFAAHVNKRDEESLIAEQLLGETPLGRSVDLLMGAGRCFFLPNTTKESCRKDDKDLVKHAKDIGFSYLDSKKDFDDLRVSGTAKLPLLGLFADVETPYDLDRRQDQVQPSLADMATSALKILSDATRDKDQGFFIMIEGSRIDHAGHGNDPVALVHEVLAYDDAFKAVLDFLQKDSTQGVLVGTSDHETGGLATARQLKPYEYPAYLWHPSVLANASRSVEWLCHDYASHRRTKRGTKDDQAYLEHALENHLGIFDWTKDEMNLLMEKPEVAPYTFADMLSRRSQTGWSTHGHSAADVNIYSSDPEVTKQLQGSRENTEVGDFLRDYLGVQSEMKTITKKLRSSSLAWMGSIPEENERLDGQSHVFSMDHYDGEHR